MTENEDSVRQLLLGIDRDGADFTQIKAQFPGLCGGVVNRTVIFAMIGARDACMRLLAKYKVDESHYHAMKLVISSQALGLMDHHVGMIRAAICAAAQSFAECMDATSRAAAASRQTNNIAGVMQAGPVPG
jgi:hypothetical protein